MLPIVATLSEWHVILALIIVFLLFGGRKLPELARGIGEAIKEFKKSQRDIVPDDAHRQVSAPPSAGGTTPAAPALSAQTQPAAPGTPQKLADSKPG